MDAVWCWGWVGEEVVDLACYVPFEAADDLFSGFALGLAFLDVFDGGLVVSHAGGGDSPEGLVGLAFPPRLRRWRTVCPEEACTGLVPHRAAKDASEVMRWGLSPAAVNRVAAVSVPTPREASSAGLAFVQRRWISVSNSLVSAVSVW